jgi:hypothetical protein
MTFVLNWHKLSPEMRLGVSSEDEVTLFRGFSPLVEDPAQGFSSVAHRTGNLDRIDDVIRAVERTEIARLVGYVSAHTTPGTWRERGLTPFVSATPDRYIAERYARGAGEQIATIVVPASQIIVDAFFAYEALVLGNIEPEQVVAVEQAK